MQRLLFLLTDVDDEVIILDRNLYQPPFLINIYSQQITINPIQNAMG